MKIIFRLSIILTLFFIPSVLTYSQSADWTIITSSRDTLRSCIIREVVGGDVNLICGVSFTHISVDSLSILIKRKGSPLWKGAINGLYAGMLVGAVAGLVFYPETPSKWEKYFGKAGYAMYGSLGGAAAGFLLGGIVGAIVGSNDDKYDLSKKSKEEKIEFLRNLIDND
jgi:Na+/proline symporter